MSNFKILLFVTGNYNLITVTVTLGKVITYNKKVTEKVTSFLFYVTYTIMILIVKNICYRKEVIYVLNK